MATEATAEPTGGVAAKWLAARTERFGLSLPGLGKHGKQIVGTVTWFRKSLEREIVRQRGQLTLTDLDLVNRAARFELAALVAQKTVAKDPTMSPEKVLDTMRMICWATTQRSAVISKLGLGRGVSGDGTAAWDALASSPGAPGGQEASEGRVARSGRGRRSHRKRGGLARWR